MRYLNKRDEFLRSYNSIVDIKESYISSNKGEVLITEDSGPFANDIGWGDSLIGRLINSTIRKAKIGVNLVRIKAVEQRLRDAMDDLLLTSTVAQLDEDDKKLYARALITTYLLALQEGVENGDPLEELKSLTEAAITAVNINNDLEGRNELLRQLNEWMKFLNEFKEEEEEKEGQGSEETINVNEAQFGNFKYLFNMLLIFKGIETERIEYNRANTIKNNSGEVSKLLSEAEPLYLASKSNKRNKGKYLLIKTKIDEILKLDPANIAAQKILNDIEIWGAKWNTSVPKKTTTQTKVPGVGNNKAGVPIATNASVSLLKYDEFKRINEGITKTVGKVAGKIWKFITGAKDERKLDKETEKLWNSLNQIYRMFVQAGEVGQDGVLSKDSEFHKFLKLTPEQIEGDPKLRLSYNRYKTNLSKIYASVRSANGITEGVDDILGKTEDMGKKIATLYSVTKTKPDGSFPQYPGTIGEVWDELVENIEGFNKYMKNVFEVKSKWNVGDTVTWKSSETGSTITKDILKIDGKKLVFKDKKGQEYTKFMSEVEKISESMMFEDVDPTDVNDDEIQNQNSQAQAQAQDTTGSAEENTEDGEVSGWKNPNSVARIKDWWGKKMDLKKWVVEKTEVEKIRINLEKKLAEKKDSIVIDGMDPVLEIVKVFNRAYKLHTTQVIPSGRSGGKVSNKTFLEYHCFGSGTPANAGEQGGPYRNIAIFNQWEDCVNNVKKDRRYQSIFNVGTRLKVGNEFIEKAGMNLRKFMTDMLDGEELYKGGTGKEQGAQAKFLDKYFGYKDDKDGKDTYYDGDSERTAINDAANGIKSPKLEKMDAKTTSIPYKDPLELKGTFFSLKLREGSSSNSYTFYFCIQDVQGKTLYLSYAQTAFHMAKMIQEDSTKPILGSKWKDLEKDDYQKTYPIRATTVDRNWLINNGTIVVSSIQLGYITKKATDGSRSEDTVNNKGKDIVRVEAEQWTIEEAHWIIDLNEGSGTADAKRIKVSTKSMDLAIDKNGGFKNIINAEKINTVRLTSR